jgi:hypothetical protein
VARRRDDNRKTQEIDVVIYVEAGIPCTERG